MFALHETTQRRVCRVVFLALSVVPTVLTLAAIAYCNRPWRQLDWQWSLASTLHLHAEVEEIDRPIPGQIRLTNLHLADLQSHATLGSFDQLILREDDGNLAIDANSLELQVDQLTTAVRSLSIWLTTSQAIPTKFDVDRLTIASRDWPALVLQDLSVREDGSTSNGHRFLISAKNPAGDAVKIAVTTEGDRLRCIVDTRNAALPAWLIGAFVPGVSSCDEAQFSGAIELESRSGKQQGKLQGALRNADLARMTNTSPHPIRGVAKIELTEILWSNGVIEAARGRIDVEGGVAAYSLLLEMQKLFACSLGPAVQNLQLQSTDELIPFDRLAVQFQLSSSGMILGGDESGVILAGPTGPLLYGPETTTWMPIANLVRLFHQPKQGWLPDTQGAQDMVEPLPLPASDRSVGASVQQ